MLCATPSPRNPDASARVTRGLGEGGVEMLRAYHRKSEARPEEVEAPRVCERGHAERQGSSEGQRQAMIQNAPKCTTPRKCALAGSRESRPNCHGSYASRCAGLHYSGIAHAIGQMRISARA